MIDTSALDPTTHLMRLTNMTVTVICYDGDEYTGALLDVFPTHGTIRVARKPAGWTQIPLEAIEKITVHPA